MHKSANRKSRKSAMHPLCFSINSNRSTDQRALQSKEITACSFQSETACCLAERRTEAPSCNVEACSAHQTWQTSSNIHTACLSTRGAAHVVNTFTQEHSLLVRPHLVARDCQHTSADGIIRFVTPIYSLL